MKRFAIITTLSVLSIAVTINDAEACKGRGGYRGGSSYRRPVYRRVQPIYHHPPVVRTVGPPVQIAPPAGQPGFPVQQPVQVTQPAAPSQPATPGQGVTSPAEQSALQLLMGSAPVANPPAAQPTETASSHVGSWTASMPNGTTIRLNLNGDGSFSWTADSNGKQSNFSGQFTYDGQKLTLTRGNDSQKLAGQLTFRNSTGFNFKLDGTSDSGLNFTRQT